MNWKHYLTEIIGGIDATLIAVAMSGLISADLALKLSFLAKLLGIWRGIVETALIKSEK